MKIEEWEEQAIQRVKDFTEKWKQEASKGKELIGDGDQTFEGAYPLELPVGEWDEQYLMSDAFLGESS